MPQPTVAELQQALVEQIYFLHTAATRFDQGNEIEAKSIANTLRMLLHDTHESVSLLGRLGLKNSFIDTGVSTGQGDSPCLNIEKRLIALTNGPRIYRPLFKNEKNLKNQTFYDWWNQCVYVDGDKNNWSRKDFVLEVANTDGGAHIGKKFKGKYHKLTRHNNTTMLYRDGVEEGDTKAIILAEEFLPVPSPHFAILRQIAHEVLLTISEKYEYDGSQYYPGAAFVAFKANFRGS